MKTNKTKSMNATVSLWCKSEQDRAFCIECIRKNGTLIKDDCWTEGKLYLVIGSVPESVASDLLTRSIK